MPRYDTAVLNGTVVIPYVGAVRCDVGVRDGRIAALADSIASGDAEVVVDARGKLVLPGAVDSHFSHRHLPRPGHRREERDGLRPRRRRDHGPQLFPHGPELPQQERPLPDDLSRSRRGDHRPRVHRFRIPHRRDDDRAARRGGLARRHAGGRLVQVLHVLQRAQPHLGLDARQRLHDGRHLRPRPSLLAHAPRRGGRARVRRARPGLPESSLRAGRADPRVQSKR